MEATSLLIENIELLAGAFLLLGLPFFVAEIIQIIRRKTASWHRFSGILTSLFCLVPLGIVEVLTAGGWLAVSYWVFNGIGLDIPVTLATAVACFFLVDFLYYWEHRISHEVNLLWASSHSVHHSADHFDQSVAGRGSIFEYLWAPLFYLPLMFIGFDPFLVFACYGLMLAWQQWIHTETVDRLPWLDPWLNTPSNHRVHHGRNPEYIDTNYGGVLMIWDRVFGTYAKEEAPVDFGLVEQLQSRNPWTVQFFVLGKMLKALGRPSQAGGVRHILFGRPDEQMAGRAAN